MTERYYRESLEHFERRIKYEKPMPGKEFEVYEIDILKQKVSILEGEMDLMKKTHSFEVRDLERKLYIEKIENSQLKKLEHEKSFSKQILATPEYTKTEDLDK